jgi:hypothetical protein
MDFAFLAIAFNLKKMCSIMAKRAKNGGNNPQNGQFLHIPQFSDNLNFNSVETLPGLNARAIFKVDSSSVFKEDTDIVPTIIDKRLLYIPWGGYNQ